MTSQTIGHAGLNQHWVCVGPGKEEVYSQILGISSLANYYSHSFFPFSAADTIALPKVGVSSDGEQVVISVSTSGAMVNGRWFKGTLDSLAELLALPKGWDSPGARRVEPKAVQSMLELLLTVLEPRSPEPSVVPTPSGGVQVEWHRFHTDLELEATRTGSLEFYFKSNIEEVEGPVHNQSIIRDYARRLGTV